MATKTYEERLASMKAAREEREEGAGLYHANINVLDQAGRNGAPRELPEPDRSRLGLRSELREAHPRAAAGRAFPHLPPLCLRVA